MCSRRRGAPVQRGRVGRWERCHPSRGFNPLCGEAVREPKHNEKMPEGFLRERLSKRHKDERRCAVIGRELRRPALQGFIVDSVVSRAPRRWQAPRW
jgi:hypothetical protein